MGKRSEFERKPRDFYPTPYSAVEPLIDHLGLHNGVCIHASDIEPQSDEIMEMDCFDVNAKAQYIITNPPWNRKILHPMIEHFSNIAPTWFLFDSDWMHTKQSVSYLTKLKKVVSIGRVKWIEGSNSVGKDNCCWYLFDNTDMVKPIEFWGRT